MKTTSQIREQEKRIDSLLWLNTTNRIKEADPETGGNLMLASNWGNAEAKKFNSLHMKRQSFLFRLFRRHYDIAFTVEYPDHSFSKKNIPNLIYENH